MTPRASTLPGFWRWSPFNRSAGRLPGCPPSRADTSLHAIPPCGAGWPERLAALAELMFDVMHPLDSCRHTGRIIMTCERPHILITGSSSGIGKATTAAAATRGFHVFAGDRSPEIRPDVVVGTGLVTKVQLDITVAGDITGAVRVISDHVGGAGLDGLANIAGIGIPGPLELMPLAQLRESFDVDFFGQVALTQPLIPLLRKARGRIVFIGSIVDRLTIPYFGALAASKSAIAAVSDTWRQELAPWGITVSLVEPGFISTGADKATKARIDHLLDHMSAQDADLYRDMFKRATDAGYRTQTSGSSPEGVADVIMTAMTAKHPKDHYLTGSKSHVAAMVARLPQSVQDELKRRAFDQPEPGSLSAAPPRPDAPE